MTVSEWTRTDTERAEAIWLKYQQCHDMAGRAGQTAGIDPAGGGIWLGESIQDVISQRDAAGCELPMYFVRIGSATYYRRNRAVRQSTSVTRGVPINRRRGGESLSCEVSPSCGGSARMSVPPD